MNIARFLSSTATHYPTHTAVEYGTLTRTYQEMNDRVNALVAAFTAAGLTPGDRVGFFMWNRPELLEVMFAAYRAGMCTVPLNARFNADELTYHCGDPEVALLVHGPEFGGVVTEAASQLPSVHTVLTIGDPATVPHANVTPYETALAAHQGAPDATVDVHEDTPAWLFYTSGTTGRPKGATLTHKNLSFVTLSWIADLMALTPADTTLHAAPLTHGAGFHAIAATAKGAKQIIPVSTAFDAEEILALMEREQVTNSWMVPTQINRLVDAPSSHTRNLSALHTIVYGGAPFHVEDLKLAISVFGPKFVQVYAQGETPMTATYLPHAEHVLGDPVGEARLASAGYERTGMEVRIVDDNGNDAPTGELGEIVVRGPAVMLGYWNRPEATAEALKDGWLHTGDIGMMDDSGYVFVLDRMKDLIITGGANVYAREVEELLLTHDAIAAVAVIGLSDRDWGERVTAIVVTEPGHTLTADDVISYAGAHLASYKRPKQVEFVDELPLSAYGKVLKRELRTQFATR